MFDHCDSFVKYAVNKSFHVFLGSGFIDILRMPKLQKQWQCYITRVRLILSAIVTISYDVV